MMVKKILVKIPDILLAILVAFSLTYALTSSLCLTYPPMNILLFVFVFISVLSISFYSKKSSTVAWILLGAAFLLSSVYLLFFIGINTCIDFLDEYFFWLGDFMMFPNIPDPQFQFVTVLSLCIAISVFSYIFVIKKYNFLIILISGVLTFGLLESYHINVNLTSFYLFLIAALISYLKFVHWRKISKGLNEYANPSAVVLWSIPVSILIIMLSSSIYASERPIEWKWLDEKILSAYNYLQNKYDYETFDYFSLSASSGFGDSNGFLGGRVILDRTNVLQVNTSRRTYLKGASKDAYTGNKWINSDDQLTEAGKHFSGLYNDTDEMLLGMKLLTGKEDFFNEYFDTSLIYVTFMNIRTKSLFIPSKVRDVDTISDNITSFVSNTGDYSASKRLTKDFQYRMRTYVPRVSTDEFQDALRKSKRGLYGEYLMKLKFPEYVRTEIIKDPEQTDQLDQTGTDQSDKVDTNQTDQADTRPRQLTESDAEITFMEIVTSYQSDEENEIVIRMDQLEELDNTSKLIYSKYLQLPEELPQRVKDLAASLVVQADNDFDKAKAIEKYLAGKYTYNLDVPSTPRNRDFVDYFLFDQQEGYCSYFASAMAILARCVGLPARYVEGYMLPPEPLENSYDTYIVSNIQAHAWVEIYFEGYGWLPFEPTAPFRSTFYAAEVPETISYGTDYNPSYEDYMAMLEQYYSSGFDRMIDYGTGSYKKGISTVTIVLIFISSAIGLVLLLILFNVLRSRFKLYKLINLPARDCVLRSYEYYLKVLNLCGLALMPAETPHQYSERIDSSLYFSPVRFRIVTDIFVKSRYSNKDVTENEKDQLTEFYPGFQSEIKINMGRFKYFILRLILGRI